MGRRPGRPLATLLAAGAVSSLGDGVTLAAAPLLAASVTRDPRAIAAVRVAWSLPWLLFALVSGAVADRADRRRLMVGADLVRVASLAVLTAAMLGGRASIPALVALFFVNAAAETVFDTAWQSTLPMVVDHDELPRANGWLQTIEFAGNGLLGPALGGVLFATAAAAPFAVDAVSFGLSALLLATVPGRFRAAGPAAGRRPTLRADIAEGVRWLLGHRVLRTICWVLAIENIVEMAGLAMLVLLAQDVLGLDARGYGLLLACLAAGAMLGGTVAARLHRRLGDQGSVVGCRLDPADERRLGAAGGHRPAGGGRGRRRPLRAGRGVVERGHDLVPPERGPRAAPGPGQQRLPAGQLGHPVGRAAAGGLVAAQLGLRALYAGAAVVLLALAALAWRLLDAGSFAAARTAASPSPGVGPA